MATQATHNAYFTISVINKLLIQKNRNEKSKVCLL